MNRQPMPPTISLRRAPAQQPWYREPWPWILMAGPVAVIVAGAVTGWLALRSYDGLIADDYYKQGLQVNQVLARARAAAERGIAGELKLIPGSDGVFALDLVSARGALPQSIQVALSHPTRAGLDQRVRALPAPSQGIYSGRIASLAPGRWNVIVEDSSGLWRIRGELHVPGDDEVRLRPAQ